MKRLAFIPLVAAVIAALGMFLEGDTATRFHRIILITVALLASLSAFVTANRFSRGDRLLTTWILFGAGYAIAAFRYITRLIGMSIPAVTLPDLANNILVIVQNALIVIALLLFVLVWRATGLAMPGSRASQTGWILAGIVIAIVVGGYPLVQGIQNAKANPVLIISTLGDMIGIALIVPLTMPALALRGGLLMHTWVYLAAMEVSWLLYDIWWALQPTLDLGARGSSILEAFRAMAIMFGFIATVAQRRALR